MFPGGPVVPRMGWVLDEPMGKVTQWSWTSRSEDPGSAGAAEAGPWKLEQAGGKVRGFLQQHLRSPRLHPA